MNDQNQKLWNVLIYLAADNNLKEESVFILTEILRAVTANEVNVFAQFDSGLSIKEYPFSEFQKSGIRASKGNRALEEIGKPLGRDGEKIVIKPAEEMLQDFLSFHLDEKAKQNMVVLSGHGNGAVGSFLSSDRSPISLTIPSLGNALRDVTGRKKKKIDILGLDSCLMSMAEVCYEVYDSVNFIVGAEGFARNTGWPYFEILKLIGNYSKIEPKDLACSIVREYVHYYAPYTISRVSVDHAACNLEYIPKLVDKLRELAKLLVENLKKENEKNKKYEENNTPEKIDRALENALILAHWRAQSYKFEQYIDLWDFCGELEKVTKVEKIKNACMEIQYIIKQELVIVSCYSGAEFQHSHGISIYFPWANSDLQRDLPAYKELKFDIETKWSAFLELFGTITEREIRKGDTNKGGKSEEQPMPIEHDLGLISTMSVRLNVLESTRLNVLESTRLNILEGTMGGQVTIPKVKNFPNKFLKYEDDCVENCVEEQ